MADRLPNVLFIMDDQHNARCMGCAGERVLRTPALDRLAEEGVRFTHAFAQSPVCMPSRVSFLSGQYVHTHGVYGNYWGALPDETPSVAHILAETGYQTAAIGKLHISIDWRTDGFQHKVLCDLADVRDDPLESDYYRYLTERGLDPDYDLGPAGSLYAFNAFISNIPAEHCVENWNGDEAVKWLRERDGRRPFFLWLTFQRPHNPLAPPAEYAQLYNPDEVVLPHADPERLDTKPEHHRRMIAERLAMARSEGDLKQALAYYYALITLIDENIAKVLRVLEEQGLMEETLIVFSSDHGDFAGEHGIMDKTIGIYESIQRVPLIFRYPKRFKKGLVRDDLVESVDLAPTILETLGIPVPEVLEGRSLLPALEGGPAIDRDAVFCERETIRSIRTCRWRLNRDVETGEGELYDRETDPNETINLFNDPRCRDVRLDLMERLVDFTATCKGAHFRGVPTTFRDRHRPSRPGPGSGGSKAAGTTRRRSGATTAGEKADDLVQTDGSRAAFENSWFSADVLLRAGSCSWGEGCKA